MLSTRGVDESSLFTLIQNSININERTLLFSLTLEFAMIEMSLWRRTKLKRFATVMKPNHTVVVAENIVKAI